MATNALEIVNDALLLVGAQPVASLNEATDRARLGSSLYDRTRKKVLRDHPWNCALKRVLLKAYSEPNIDLSLGAGYNVQDSVITVTLTSGDTTNLAVNQRIWAKSVQGKGTITAIVNSTSLTLTVDAPYGTNTLDSGEWRLYGPKPAWGYEQTMDLPADYLRSVLTDPHLVRYTYKIEGRNIVTNEIELPFVYVYDLQDTTQFDPLLDRALARCLASQMAFPLTGQVNAARDLEQLYRQVLSEAKTADAMEQTPDRFQDNVLIAVRAGLGIGMTADTVPLPPPEPF